MIYDVTKKQKKQKHGTFVPLKDPYAEYNEEKEPNVILKSTKIRKFVQNDVTDSIVPIYDDDDDTKKKIKSRPHNAGVDLRDIMDADINKLLGEEVDWGDGIDVIRKEDTSEYKDLSIGYHVVLSTTHHIESSLRVVGVTNEDMDETDEKLENFLFTWEILPRTQDDNRSLISDARSIIIPSRCLGATLEVLVQGKLTKISSVNAVDIHNFDTVCLVEDSRFVKIVRQIGPINVDSTTLNCVYNILVDHETSRIAEIIQLSKLKSAQFGVLGDEYIGMSMVWLPSYVYLMEGGGLSKTYGKYGPSRPGIPSPADVHLLGDKTCWEDWGSVGICLSADTLTLTVDKSDCSPQLPLKSKVKIPISNITGIRFPSSIGSSDGIAKTGVLTLDIGKRSIYIGAKASGIDQGYYNIFCIYSIIVGVLECGSLSITEGTDSTAISHQINTKIVSVAKPGGYHMFKK